MLNNETVNICTIEDPIEYGIDNINQMQIKPGVGLTFAAGLRALLRQDPNILMVGEIRDAETAEIAANAAMTGHLVLSTLHTNNGFLAPQRLIEMGSQPYLVNSVLSLVIGQRLVRKLCPHCRIALRDNTKYLEEQGQALETGEALEKLARIGLLPAGTTTGNIQLYRPRGCHKCNQSGYRGRVGIYEVLDFDDAIRGQLLKDSSEAAVKRYFQPKNALTMAEDGIYKVLRGLTTFEEVMRVTKE
jgi:type II secretory ATPase GspE/PulE/Tfp pilus assembly ATPase PilB-like protein